MLERRAVTRDTVRTLVGLKVRADQQDLVSANSVTLAQTPYEPGSVVWGLWDGETPVGLVAMVHPQEYPFHAPGDDVDAAYLWRLMIDSALQGRGYGKAAINEAVRQTRDWGLPRLTCSFANEQHSNIGFYLKLGFRDTGRIVEDERVLSMVV